MSRRSTHTSLYGGLVDPEDQAPLENLELVSTQIVDGYLSGQHRSRMKGGCTEFAEHRAYSPGDEVRLLDWKVFAKSDRYYIKQFEEETNLNTLLVLDGSGSMNFSMSTKSKFTYARAACASFARLLLSQRDPVGLAVSSLTEPRFIPSRSSPAHFYTLLSALSGADAAHDTVLPRTLDEMVRRMNRRGLFMIFSDCFVDLDAFLKTLKLIRSRGHQVILMHTMAPEELDFSFRNGSRFQCMEVEGYHVDLDPALIRNEYLASIKLFLERLKKVCLQSGCDYVPLNTGEPLGERLALYLRERTAKAKGAFRR
ncbi:MAG: DUF58 domain-containing protein [Verrucomicrobia bacterium]|nr:DUF58 domain-containing protein [Verrucomicrobiota bacterium]